MRKCLSIIVLLVTGFQVQSATILLKNKTGSRIGIEVKSNKRRWEAGILEGGDASLTINKNECIEEIFIGTDEDFKKTAWSGSMCEDHTFELTKDSYGYYQAK